MARSNSLAIILFVAGVLFTVGFACNQGDSPATSNTAASPGNPASSPASSPTNSTPKDISGNYDATGTNEEGGGAYKATLIVTPHDDVYQFSWQSGGHSYDGVGVRTDDAVAVSFTEGETGKGCGVVLYKIGPDGSLDGKIGYWGVNNAEMEKGTRTSGSDLEGKYDVTGKNPDGKDYKGTLEVKNEGEGYTFAWNAGNSFEGYGMKTGDTVIVGFGGKQCSFVSYEVRSDGTLEGRWGSQGIRTFGTETAKKE